MNRRQLFALIATIAGSGIVILDGFVVNLALPNIAHDLHASFSGLQWIVDGYLLSLSALILLGGSLGDIFGRKRTYIVGLIGFGVSSLMCGLAPNLTMLILLRVIQGLFGALLVPGALAIINTNIPIKLRGLAFGRWTAWSGITAVLGPLLGGYLISVASWRWIFFINVPLIIVCVIMAAANIDETKDSNPRKVDISGATLAAAALAAITYGLIEGPVKHWSRGTVAILVTGVILGVLFYFVEAHSKDPMLKLNLFKSRNFSGVNITTFSMYGGLAGFLFVLVIYLQTTLGYSSIKAGVSLMPVSVMLLLFSSRVGVLAHKFGPRLFMTFGPLTSAIGMFSLVRLGHGDRYLTDVFPGVFLFALGLAITVAPLTITVMNSVRESESGIASGINNAVSRVAGLIVVAVLGLLGAGQVYRFGIILCASMLAAAGIISYVLIRNPKIS
ncbi:MAG TPA: MFS transporter [Candidatus Saccharimonadales bacterium]|nr:MFS transporter [Candidatus Saccharimonadales bacterium]